MTMPILQTRKLMSHSQEGAELESQTQMTDNLTSDFLSPYLS